MEAINAIQNLSNLKQLNLASIPGLNGLVDMLNGPGPFTVIAPNNDAISEIPDDEIEELLKPENFAKLEKVVLRHIVAQHIMIANVPKGETILETLGGEKITVNFADEIMIKSSAGNATVIKSDIVARNGIIHILDGVIGDGF